jgi:hypothetical protein
MSSRTSELYDTVDWWLDAAMQVIGVDGIYLHLNDIPDKRRKEITDRADKLHVAWTYEDYMYLPDDRTESRRIFDEDKPYERFVKCRNRTLEYALENDYTHMLFVDSDVIIRPDTAVKLEEHMDETVGMCSVLVNNTAKFILHPRTRNNVPVQLPPHEWRYNIGETITKPPGVPNVFAHIKGKNLKFDTLMRVGVTGAAAILNLSYIKKFNIRYQCHPSGEDFSLCEQLGYHGAKILCDTSLQHEAFHIQDERLQINVQAYLNGSRPKYTVKEEIPALQKSKKTRSKHHGAKKTIHEAT